MSTTILHVTAKAEDVKRSDLYSDLKKYTMAFAKEYVRIGADELTKEAKNAMSMFYGDYDPQYYDRTYDLYSNSYSRYIHNNSQKKFLLIPASLSQTHPIIMTGLYIPL